MNVSASAVSSLAAARRVAAAASSLLRTHSSSSLPLPLLLRSCASAVKLIQSRIRHKQKQQQQCVVRCVVAVALLRLPLPLLPSLLIDTKKMKFKRGGSDAMRRVRFVSFRFVCFSGGRASKGGMLRWRCVVLVVVGVPLWRELDLKHDADNDDDDADDDDTKRAFGDGNFWFDCVKRRRNAMRRCWCRLLLLFGAPNRRRQRSVLITLLLLLFCCSLLFPPHTHTHTLTLPVTNAVIKCAAISLAHRRWQRRWLINYKDGCVDGDVDSANLSHALFTLYVIRFT